MVADFFRFPGRFRLFLIVTVCIFLILSASSGTKNVVAAGTGTRSAVVGGSNVGSRTLNL